MHKFKIEALFRHKWANYVEEASNPVEAVAKLWRRRPGCIPAIVTLLGPTAVGQKACWTVTEIAKNREQVVINFELNFSMPAQDCPPPVQWTKPEIKRTITHVN